MVNSTHAYLFSCSKMVKRIACCRKLVKNKNGSRHRLHLMILVCRYWCETLLCMIVILNYESLAVLCAKVFG